jgi:hypothetical protein
MAFPGPKVPHRTLRSIALDKGTAPAGFEGALSGVMVDGYNDIAQQPAAPGLALRSPDPQPVPFKVGG